MEQNLQHFDASKCVTFNKVPNYLDESKTSSFSTKYQPKINSDLKQRTSFKKKENLTKTVRPKVKKRVKNYQIKDILSPQFLPQEISIEEILKKNNKGLKDLVKEDIDLYESIVEKKDKMEVIDRISPLNSIQEDELNSETLCNNEMANNRNLRSNMSINEEMYEDHDINHEHMYSDTGMIDSEPLNESQIYTNTCVNELDLNVATNQSQGLTNPSQTFDLLQNMHYDTNNTGQNLSSQNNYVSMSQQVEEINLEEVDQYNTQYMYQYNRSQENQQEQYVEYNEDMDYGDNVDYILNEEMDYVMNANYNQDNTNLASNNYDYNNVFNNVDNLTQSQDQLSNTHTVSNFQTQENNMEELVTMDYLTNEKNKELIRNNSINVLIENADKNLDKEVMNSILRDLICPICLEYFYFPVTVACGHTFCRYCIGHSKLSGKMCPLCRQPIGRSLNINTILSNLVKSLKLRKRGQTTLVRAPDVSQLAEKIWWDEHCLKPFVSVPLFIRIMFGEIAQAPVFFDDLCSCLVDYFSTGNKWYKSKWVFTIEDFRHMRNLIGLQLSSENTEGKKESEMTQVNDSNNVRLHHWVEDYLIANPHLCFRSEVMYPLTLKVYHDVNHKIEGTMFSALDIPYKLPWDAGRHVKSLLHLPHSSVSLSHLIFAQCPNGQFGILDVGSTIGTMIKIQGVHVLKSGDRIHIGDKHEVDVYIYKDGIGTPFKDYKWDANTNQVINYSEYISTQTTQKEQKEQSKQGEQSHQYSNGVSPEEEIIDVEVEGNNLYELDSYLKLRIFADLQVERDVWICPKGVILGRGPVTQSSYKKLSITTQNGYISREHCLIYYDGSRPSGSRWLLRDMSTLGTFLKLKPFQEPLPMAPGFVFKVGQCKVEVGSPHELSRRVPSSATLILSQLLQSHMEPFRLVEIQTNLGNISNTHGTSNFNHGMNNHFPNVNRGIGPGSRNMEEGTRQDLEGRSQLQGNGGVGEREEIIELDQDNIVVENTMERNVFEEGSGVQNQTQTQSTNLTQSQLQQEGDNEGQIVPEVLRYDVL